VFARVNSKSSSAGTLTSQIVTRIRRTDRVGATSAVRTSAEVDAGLLDRVATPDTSGRKLLADAVDRIRLTARGYHRVLRVARTLADLDGSDGVTRVHVAEALAYRRIVPGRNALLMGA
jgi:predicted ATPase with chaperone activity